MPSLWWKVGPVATLGKKTVDEKQQSWKILWGRSCEFVSKDSEFVIRDKIKN